MRYDGRFWTRVCPLCGARIILNVPYDGTQRCRCQLKRLNVTKYEITTTASRDLMWSKRWPLTRVRPDAQPLEQP